MCASSCHPSGDGEREITRWSRWFRLTPGIKPSAPVLRPERRLVWKVAMMLINPAVAVKSIAGIDNVHRRIVTAAHHPRDSHCQLLSQRTAPFDVLLIARVATLHVVVLTRDAEWETVREGELNSCQSANVPRTRVARRLRFYISCVCKCGCTSF
jgi:hypothetical protein